MSATEKTAPILWFDTADMNGSTLRPVAPEQLSFDTRDGQPVVRSAVPYRFAADALPKEEALTVTVTYWDDHATFTNFAYCDKNGRPHYLNIDRRGEGGFVTATFPLQAVGLYNQLPETEACLALGRMTLRRLEVTVGAADDLSAPAPAFAPQTAQNDMAGKGVAGYQVWFRAGEQGEGWFHWGRWQNGRISPCHEMYPSVDEYRKQGVTLRTNGQAPLGNGDPAEVFTSSDDGVIDTHMRWMKEYDIDGAAVQRFFSCSSPSRSTGRSTLRLIADKAEKYERLFYVMYDFSGCGRQDPDFFLRSVQLDFIFNAEETGVVSSPSYAHLNGRPVVCFWGISGDPESRYLYGTTASALIAWFHNRGYSVIVGTPDNDYTMRTGDNLAPFLAADMISPWTVGRYRPRTVKEWLKKQLPIDLAFCKEHGIAYQPVVYAGFAWTNLGNRGNINDITHDAGQFLWTQVHALAEGGADNLYFAMFDEYDEGTAIMKAASDYFEIPTDQYYLTYAADGFWLSNDYYLRTAGAAIDMMQGETPLRAAIDVPHSCGPVYWRNSFESREITYRGYDNQRHTGLGQLDVCLHDPLILEGVHTQANVSDAAAKSGRFSLHIKGTGETLFRMAVTAFTADSPLKLTYSLNAANDGGKAVYVCLLTEDGGSIASPVAIDTVGEWQTVSVMLEATSRIIGIAAAFDGEGDFDAFIDDILLEQA